MYIPDLECPTRKADKFKCTHPECHAMDHDHEVAFHAAGLGQAFLHLLDARTKGDNVGIMISFARLKAAQTGDTKPLEFALTFQRYPGHATSEVTT